MEDTQHSQIRLVLILGHPLFFLYPPRHLQKPPKSFTAARRVLAKLFVYPQIHTHPHRLIFADKCRFVDYPLAANG
jgi:hypothetical protein